MAQHDYNIANQTGANFRADLNNALSAIASNNSGSSEPSTTFAYEWWIDTSANVLKLRNSANNAWITMPFSITADNTIDINAGTVNGITSLSFSSGATVTSILDEDNLASDSATALATQQSIKAYVDSQVTAQDLDISDGSSTIAIDLDSETLSLLGGTGVTSTASGNGVTFAIGQSVGTSDNVVFNQVTGALVGNASTATALATARNISGVSFDGTANITLDTDDIGEGSSNKYYTAERVDDQVNTLLTAGANISLTYDDAAGTLTIANTNSADITSVVAGDGLTGGGTAGDVTLAVGVDDSSIEINSDALRVKASGITNAMLGGSIANAKLANSSVTINSQAIALGGSHTFDTDDIGEGSSNLYYTDARANSAIDARVTNTFINNLSGVVADTATALATGRTIALSGDVTASGVSFDGTGNISLSTTIAANSVALGTDTTGNYVATIADAGNTRITVANSGSESAAITLDIADDAIGSDQIANNAVALGTQSTGNYVSTISGTTNEIDVSGSGSETATVTIGLPDDVTIAGNLTVNGTTTTVNSDTLSVTDPLIKLAKANSGADSLDIGFYGLYDTSGSQDLYAGLFRDANDSGKFKLFKDLQVEPTTTVNTSGTGYAVGTLVSNLEGDVTGNVTGNVSGSSGSTTGNAATATALATGRTIGMTGDVVWTSASFDGSGNVTGTATIQANSVALGTDTTGDYVGTITGGTGITSTGATSGEGIAHTLSVDASQTQITSVGALDAGSITSGFGSIDVGSSAITTTGTVTGNTLAGTLSTAAQTNITSLGTLTTLTVDDITINGSTISDAGDLTFDVGGDIILDADGADFRYKDAGTEFLRINNGTTGAVLLSPVSDKDLIFKGNDGGSEIVALTLDMSNAGRATFNENVTVGGNLDVSGADVTITSNIIHAGDTNTFFGFNDADTFRITTGGSEALRVDSSQNLFVGKTSSGLNTAGVEFASSGRSRFTRDGNNVAEFNRKTDDGSIVTFNKDATAIGTIGVLNSNNLTIACNTADHGGLQFGTHEITPMEAGSDANGTINLGSANSRFQDLHLSGTGYFGTSVGIGTTSPDCDLEIATSTSDTGVTLKLNGNRSSNSDVGSIIFENASDSVAMIRASRVGGNNDAADMTFFTQATGGSNAERMRIDSSGNVGIGGTSGGERLLLTGSATAGARLKFTQSTASLSGQIQQGSSGFGIGALGSQAMLFDTNGSERMRIDSSGNVGIGTSTISATDWGSASKILQIAGTQPLLSLKDTDVTDGEFQIANSGQNLYIYDAAASDTRMFINDSGSIGVGTSSPSGGSVGGKVLHLVNSGATASVRVDRSDSSTTGTISLLDANSTHGLFGTGSKPMAFSTDSTERMRIDSSGKVGIGITSPVRTLQVHTAGSNSSYISINNGNTGATVSDGVVIGAASDSVAYFWNYENADMAFATNNTERMRLDSSGNLGIGLTSPTAALHVKDQINLTNANNNAVVGLKATRFGYSSGYKVLQLGDSAVSTSSNIAIGVDLSGNSNSSFTGSGEAIYFRNAITFRTPNDDNDAWHSYITMNDGFTGINTTSPTHHLHVNSGATNVVAVFESSDTEATIRIKDTTGTAAIKCRNDFRFNISETNEKMRIDSSGNVIVGATSNQGVGGLTFGTSSNGINVTNNTTTGAGNGHEFYVFRRNSTQIGSIVMSNTDGVTYSTSSDARLKNVLGEAKGLEIVNKLNPVNFEWKESKKVQDGLIAQEVEELIPHAVAVSEEGHYSMDYSQVVTPLIKAIQEQQEQIDALQSEINILKGE